MKTSFRCLFCLSLLMIIQCHKQEKKTIIEIQPGVRFVQPYDYTDDSTWMNGINIKQGNQFFFNIEPEAIIPIQVNQILLIPSCHKATVLAVTKLIRKTYTSLFVIVDRKLDPQQDGYPNTIRIDRYSTPVSAITSEDWKNGIDTRNPNRILLDYDPTMGNPIKAGDSLMTCQSVIAAIQSVIPCQIQDIYDVIQVTVDRPLNPDADGAPHSVSIILNHSQQE